MNSRAVSCEKARIFSRPVGGRHAGAAGSNGGRILGMAMPGGPLCAAAGAAVAIKPSAKMARAGHRICGCIALLPGNIVVPHGLTPDMADGLLLAGFRFRRQDSRLHATRVASSGESWCRGQVRMSG